MGHDKVKRELGAAYEDQFGRTPFPRRGGLCGTTARLQGWCSSLTLSMKMQTLSPHLAANVIWVALRCPWTGCSRYQNRLKAKVPLIGADTYVGKSCLIHRL